MAEDLRNVKWHEMYRMNDCCLQADFFYRTLTSIIDLHAPLELHFFKANDRPWITPYFKNLILERDNAFSTQNHALYRKLQK